MKELAGYKNGEKQISLSDKRSVPGLFTNWWVDTSLMRNPEIKDVEMFMTYFFAYLRFRELCKIYNMDFIGTWEEWKEQKKRRKNERRNE